MSAVLGRRHGTTPLAAGIDVPEYDFIVVGAGSVGCVVAARLCANPAARVPLLEAGGAQRSVAMEVPAERGYVTTLQAGARVTIYPVGKVLGGSGAINAMAHVRTIAQPGHHHPNLGHPGIAPLLFCML